MAKLLSLEVCKFTQKPVLTSFLSETFQHHKYWGRKAGENTIDLGQIAPVKKPLDEDVNHLSARKSLTDCDAVKPSSSHNGLKCPDNLKI